MTESMTTNRELALPMGGNDPRYALAVRKLLGDEPASGASWDYVGSVSPHTRRAYQFALSEFFLWLRRERGRDVRPEEVTSVDVERYAQWLNDRTFTLERDHITDPFRLAIHDVVSRLGVATRSTIRAALPDAAIPDDGEPLAVLGHHLGRMVLHGQLVRTPTLARVREQVPLAGLRVFRIAVLPNGTFASAGASDLPSEARVIDLDEVYQYRVPRPKGVGRRTIVARLHALSAFWDLLREGENVGSSPVLQHYVVRPILRRVSRGLRQEARRVSRSQKPDPSAILKLLERTSRPRTIAEHRNRALLLLLLFTGIRVEEAVTIRRDVPMANERFEGWFQDGDPAKLVVLRKGGRRQELPYPPIALEALKIFQSRLADLAAPMDAQSVDPESPRYVAPESPRWRYQELVVRNDAPLFPPLFLWGNNAPENYEEFRPNAELPEDKPLTTSGVRHLLHAMGRAAELDDDEIAKLHPHALRHFAAVAMYKGGVALPVIQEMLGHESITTTEAYIQELVSTIEHSAQNEILSYLAGFEVAPRREPTIVETDAELRSPKRSPKRSEKRSPEEAPKTPEIVEAPAEAPKERSPKRSEEGSQEPPQVAEIIEAAAETDAEPEPLPRHVLPVVPIAEPDAVEAVATKEGVAVQTAEQGVIAIGGQPASADPETERLLDGVSAGSPDYVYEAMSELQVSDALKRHAEITGKIGRIEDAAEKERDKSKRAALREPLKKLRSEQKSLETELRALRYDPIEFTRLQPRMAGKTRRPGEAIQKKDGKEKVQQNPWLLEHYDPWPLHYGIGRESLLVWHASGQAKVAGYVVQGSVIVPPIPVLAPEQIDPQTEAGRGLLDCAEALYQRWLEGTSEVGPSPTRAFGVVRWWSLWSYLSGFLKRHEDRELDLAWQPFSAPCEVGLDLRAHDPKWLCVWLESNAHTYMTARRAFEDVARARGKGAQEDDQFERSFAIGTFQGLKPTDLPEWIADDDPVAAIHERDPKEWDAFVEWLDGMTARRIGRSRRKDAAAQRRFIVREIKVGREVLQSELELYYEQVDALRSRESDSADKDAAMELLKAFEERFKTEYGFDPKDPELRAMKRQERIATLLDEAFPRDAAEGAPRNVFGASKLFDPKQFKIDRKLHTIVHDEEFRRDFRAKYGQDSELLTRRAARAMWEYARERKVGTSEYSFMYSILLSYMASVIPAGAEMERQLLERTPRIESREARMLWLADVSKTARELIHADDSFEEQMQRRAGEDEDSWGERLAELIKRKLPDADVTPEMAIAAYKSGKLMEAVTPEIELTEQSALAEVAAGGLGVRAPDLGRQERSAFEREKKGHVPNYVGSADRDVKLSHSRWIRASGYLRNAAAMMPTPFAMIQAMNP